MRRFISIALAFVMVMTATVLMTGCSNEEYPVNVANIVIEKEPENIVVLDASTADIISYIGFDKKWAGRSDSVDQEWLKVVPDVGTAAEPNVDKIVACNADIVFADDSLSPAVKSDIESKNIKVVTMSKAKTAKQLETNYNTVSKILGGNTTGLAKGNEAYKKLISEMDKIKSVVASSKTTDVLDTVCYLFVKDNKLRMMTSGSYGDMLLGYTGAVNAAVNIDNDMVDYNILKVANPTYIFYADNETLEMIKQSNVLSALTAVKTNKTLMVTAEEMERQGQTAINTLQKMAYFMYPSLAPKNSTSTPDQPIKDNVQANNQPATQAATNTTADNNAQATTAPESSSVAADYKITITNNLNLKPEDENANVKAMQKRLYDLGYIDDAENVTGYYGEISKTAVSSFQKNNGINETGIADNATLVIMFDSNAVKASS